MNAMNASRWMLTIAVAGFVCTGCGKDPVPPDAPPAAPAAPPAAPPAPEAEADDTPSAAALPVADDFEDEAATEVTEQSYRAQLDTIEKEVEADLAADQSK